MENKCFRAPLVINMAEDSNARFRHGVIPSSIYNTPMVSFQSGPINAFDGMVSGGVNGSGGIGISSGMFLSGNPSVINNACAAIPAGISSSNLLLEPVPGLKHDTRLAADWSFEEQAMLGEGLVKYAGEPSIKKYIKIAARLRDKTVRDVAVKCRWMTKKEHGKRRKPDGHYAGKKLKDSKGKTVDSNSKPNIHVVPPDRTASYSLTMHNVNHNDQFSCEAPVLDGPMRNLMDENVQAFNQIAANLSTFKIQDNIDLFRGTRNNIAAILHSMSEMPGIMSLMHPLPVSVDEQLLGTILPGTSQVLTFGANGGIHLKQEPRC